MLNFRTASILFAAILAWLVYAGSRQMVGWWVYVVWFVVYTGIVAAGSYFVQSHFFVKTICSGNTSEKKIALSFDDGPAENYTPAVIEILAQHNIEAAFFCIGKNISGNEKLLQQLDAQGHIVGNHSFSHSPFFDLFRRQKMQDDIAAMNEACEKIIGKKPMLFRPPFGVTTPVMNKVLKALKLKAIGWNLRSYDTMFTDEEKLYERVIARIKPGAIILFHDTMEITTRVLPRVITYAQNNGYTFERPDQLINLPAYA